MSTNRWFDADYLVHFGIRGQKWGVRRYQNEDGTLTEEGRRRYLDLNDQDTINRINTIVGRATDQFNSRGLKEVNKKYDQKYGRDYDFYKDDKANLEYTKEMMEKWKSTYREVLAKDLGTDPKSLEGQKWLDEMFAYKTNLDEEYSDLDKKVNKKSGGNEKPKSETSKRSASSSVKQSQPKSKNTINMNPKPLKDYSNTKMSQKKAINQAYDDLEKIYPNFSSLPLKQQDTLWMNYLNASGLYKWTY